MKKRTISILILILLLLLANFSQAQTLRKFKIGVVVYDNTAPLIQGVVKYYREHIAPAFNVEFIVSENIQDSNHEISFIENCAASGAKGIIALYNTTDWEIIAKKCQQLGLYYMYCANLSDKDLAVYRKYRNMLGGIGQDDYKIMYDMAKYFLEKGARKIVMATGGKDIGVKLFIDRYRGVVDAIKDFQKQYPNEKIDFKELGGFPNEQWFAQQAQLIATNPDVIIASFEGEYFWLQPLINAGKAGKIKLGVVSTINDLLVKGFDQGYIHYAAAFYPQLFGFNFAFLYNALTGYVNYFKVGGEPINARFKLAVITTKEDMRKWLDLINDKTPPISADDLKTICRAFNRKATLNDFLKLLNETSYEDIIRRRK